MRSFLVMTVLLVISVPQFRQFISEASAKFRLGSHASHFVVLCQTYVGGASRSSRPNQGIIWSRKCRLTPNWLVHRTSSLPARIMVGLRVTAASRRHALLLR